MKKKPILKKQMNRQYYYLFGLSFMLMLLAFVIESPQSLVSGMMTILVSPSQLFTDYMEIASVGSTLLNVAIMLGISIYSYKKLEIPLNGTVIGSLGMRAGFSFFGKNLFNSIPFMIGVWIYTKVTKQNYRNYVIVGLFGSALGPLISFLAFSGVLPQGWSVLIAYLLASSYLNYPHSFLGSIKGSACIMSGLQLELLEWLF